MKRIPLLIACLVLAGTLSVALGQRRTQVQYAFWGLPEEVAVQEQLKATFEAQNPDIEIVLNHISLAGDFAALMLTRIAGGNPPDVMYLGEALVDSLAARNVLTDLTPYIERDGVDLGDYWEMSVQEVVDEDGRMFAFPKDNTPLMIYYNKELFDNAGLPHPSVDWSWDDFRAAAAELTVDGNGDGSPDQWGFVPGLWWGEYISAIYGNGGRALSADGTQCMLDESEAVEALQNLADLMHVEPIAAPSPEAMTNMGVGGFDLFNGGQAAMISAGRWGAFFFQPLEAEWGVAPFPSMSTPATVMLYVNLVIPRTARQADAAWEFVKFVVSEEGQRINASSGLGLPVLKSVTADGESWLLPDEPREHIDIFTDSLQNRAQSLPFHSEFAETFDEIAARELDALWRGTSSAREVTSLICPEIESVLGQRH